MNAAKKRKARNVSGPKPRWPALELHMSTSVESDAELGSVLAPDRQRVLITRPGRVLLSGQNLDAVDVGAVMMLVAAPRMARLLTRIVRSAKPGTVSLADFTEAQQMVDALPFEVLP